MKTTAAILFSALLFGSTASASEEFLDDLQAAIDTDEVTNSDIVNAGDVPPKRELAAADGADSSAEDSGSWSHVWE